MVGNGFTVTITVAVAVQQISVRVRVYVVVTVGVAPVTWHVAQTNPVDGAHENVPAPLPVNVVLNPMHIAVGNAEADTLGAAGVVMVITSEALPQPFVTVSV